MATADSSGPLPRESLESDDDKDEDALAVEDAVQVTDEFEELEETLARVTEGDGQGGLTGSSRSDEYSSDDEEVAAAVVGVVGSSSNSVELGGKPPIRPQRRAADPVVLTGPVVATAAAVAASAAPAAATEPSLTGVDGGNSASISTQTKAATKSMAPNTAPYVWDATLHRWTFNNKGSEVGKAKLAHAQLTVHRFAESDLANKVMFDLHTCHVENNNRRRLSFLPKIKRTDSETFQVFFVRIPNALVIL